MTFLKRLEYLFYPKRCIYCNRVILPSQCACEHCKDHIPRIQDPVCYRCGRSRKTCTCKQRRRAFVRCVSAMEYTGTVQEVILKLKHTDDRNLVDTMAQEMVKALRARTDATAFDVVTCIPMHKTEQRRRGFNQSELLAKAVATILDIPFESLLHKPFVTQSQKSLSRIERSGNLLGAFDAKRSVEDERILLVDDLITTGSTLHEGAKMLKLFGAASVTALTFAAAVPSESDKDAEE